VVRVATTVPDALEDHDRESRRRGIPGGPTFLLQFPP
jgi:hypothetical protein